MNEVRKHGRLTIRLSIKPLLMILPGIFFLANLIRMLMISSVPYFVSLYAAGIIGILMVLFSRKYRLDKIVLFFLFYGITLVFNWMIVGNISFNDLAVNGFLIGITFIMLIHQWTYRHGSFIFYVSAAIMAYEMNASAVRRILVSSTNYISILMILAAAFYYASIELDGRKMRLIDILPAAICFSISIWARGRGGILSTAILLTLMLVIYMQTLVDKRARRAVLFFIVLLAIVALLIIQDVNILDSFMSLGKWDTRGADNSERILIWGDYISKVQESFVFFLFGAPLKDIPVIYSAGENCHNSFLQLHAYNGIFMFFTFLVLLIRSLIFYWKNRRFVSLAMLATIVIRGMSDKFIFGQYGMPIMLFFVLYPIIAKQQYGNINNEEYNLGESMRGKPFGDCGRVRV